MRTLSSYGGVADAQNASGALTGTDCATALHAAFADGGEIELDGHYLLASPVSIDLAGGRVKLVGGRLSIAVASDQTALTIANSEQAVVEGVTFSGGPQNVSDAGRALSFIGCDATVRDSSFYALSSYSLSTGAILHASGSILATEDVHFYGCTASNAVVFVELFRGLTMSRDEFVDIGTLDGIPVGKLADHPATRWLRVGDENYHLPNATNQGVIRLTDVRMDEGALFGIDISPAGRDAHVHIAGLQMSTYNDPAAIGVKIARADYVEIEDCSIGTYVSGAALHDAINLFDCGDVGILRLWGDSPASRLTANAISALTVRDCPNLSCFALTAVADFIHMAHDRELPSVVPPMLVNDNAVLSGTGNKTAAIKPGSPAAWQNVAHTSQSFNGSQSFAIQFTVVTPSEGLAIGLSTSPTTAGAYNSIAASFIGAGGKWDSSYGTLIAHSNYAAGDVLRLEHTAGGNLVWKINGTAVRTIASPWSKPVVLYGDIDMYGGVPAVVTVDSFAVVP